MRAAGLVSSDPHRMGGTHWIFRFANGFGASVTDSPVVTNGSPFELAVLKYRGKGDRFDLVYDTGVTDDVERGDLDDMNRMLAEIEALPPSGILHVLTPGATAP